MESTIIDDSFLVNHFIENTLNHFFLKEFPGNSERRQTLKAHLEKFASADDLVHKEELAIHAATFILGNLQLDLKSSFPKLIGSFSDFQKIFYGTISFYRDHVLHQLRVFLLGSFLLNREPWKGFLRSYVEANMDIEDIISRYSDKTKEVQAFVKYLESHLVSHYWAITSLFHDISYPIQKLQGINKHMASLFADFKGFSFETAKLNIESATTLLFEELLREMSTINGVRCTAVYYRLVEYLSKLDHGPLSAMVLLSQVEDAGNILGSLNRDKMLFLPVSRLTSLSKQNPFLWEVKFRMASLLLIESARAIAFHNRGEFVLLSPFSALLFLCDELQEWGRPALLKSDTKSARRSVISHIELRLVQQMPQETYLHVFCAKVDFSDSRVKAVLDQSDWDERICYHDKGRKCASIVLGAPDYGYYRFGLVYEICDRSGVTLTIMLCPVCSRTMTSHELDLKKHQAKGSLAFKHDRSSRPRLIKRSTGELICECGYDFGDLGVRSS